MLKQTLLAWLFTNNFQCPRGKKSLVNSNFHATLALSSHQGEKETEHFLSRRKRFLMMMEKLFHARSVVAAAVSCLTKK